MVTPAPITTIVGVVFSALLASASPKSPHLILRFVSPVRHLPIVVAMGTSVSGQSKGTAVCRRVTRWVVVLHPILARLSPLRPSNAHQHRQFVLLLPVKQMHNAVQAKSAFRRPVVQKSSRLLHNFVKSAPLTPTVGLGNAINTSKANIVHSLVSPIIFVQAGISVNLSVVWGVSVSLLMVIVNVKTTPSVIPAIPVFLEAVASLGAESTVMLAIVNTTSVDVTTGV